MLHISDDKERLVLQTEFLDIRYDAKHNILLTNWSGWLDSKRGHTGCMQILDSVKEYSTSKILNDNSKVTGHSGDTKWMSEVWIPALREAGVKYFAWVYSHEFFTQMEIDNTVDKSSGIAMRTFFLSEDAKLWLLMH